MTNNIENQFPASLKSDINGELLNYRIVIKFLGVFTTKVQHGVFDALKTFGELYIRDMQTPIYILDFKSELKKVELEVRLKELAGPTALFNFTIDEILKA